MLKAIYQNFLRNTFNTALNSNLNNNYISGFPQLKNSVFSRLSQTWMNHNIEILNYDESEKLVLVKKDNLYLFISPGYPYILREIFCWNMYFINPRFLRSSEYVVFDMGMNRGYASLYFANQPWCKGVYGFELNEDIYELANKNIELNKSLKSKIETFNFGLGANEGKIKTYYLPDRDGICTTSREFLSKYAPEEMDNIVEKECLLKKSSSVLKEIVNRNKNIYIILKIDVEGAEYDIINEIIREYPSIFNKVDIIIGESHLGLEPLANALKTFNYKEVSNKRFNPKTQDFLFVKN